MKILFIDTLYRGLLSEKGHFQSSHSRESFASLMNSLTSQGFSSGYFYTRELSKFGVDASVVYANSQRVQDAWAKENKIPGTRSSSVRWKYWQLISRLPIIGMQIHVQSELMQILLNQIQLIKPDYIYNLDLNLFSGKMVRKLKLSGIKVLGQIASPLPPKSFYKDYDHIFSAHPGQVKYFVNNGISSSWLPLAIDNEIKKNFDSDGWPERFRDVTFIGTFGRHQKNTAPLLREVSKHAPSLEIYTFSSKKRLQRLGLGSHYRGKAWGKTMLRVFAESKIVINRHGKVANGFAVNYRLFEATGMGALVLTESAPNMSDLFAVGEEIITYSTNQEAAQKVKTLLDNFGTYSRVARAGQRKTLNEHTFSARAAQLLRDLEKIENTGFGKPN